MRLGFKIAIGVIAVGGGGVGWYLYSTYKSKKVIAGKIYKKIDDKTEEHGDFRDMESDDGFNSGYWNDVLTKATKDPVFRRKSKVTKASFLPSKETFRLAQILYEADRANDDEQAVYAVFKHDMKTKIHLSQVVFAFNKLYKKDLHAYLSDFLDDQEMEKVTDYYKKYSQY